MADEVILNVSSTPVGHHQTCASSKLKRKTLEALSRGNAVTDECYKQREFDKHNPNAQEVKNKWKELGFESNEESEWDEKVILAINEDDVWRMKEK